MHFNRFEYWRTQIVFWVAIIGMVASVVLVVFLRENLVYLTASSVAVVACLVILVVNTSSRYDMADLKHLTHGLTSSFEGMDFGIDNDPTSVVFTTPGGVKVAVSRCSSDLLGQVAYRVQVFSGTDLLFDIVVDRQNVSLHEDQRIALNMEHMGFMKDLHAFLRAEVAFDSAVKHTHHELMMKESLLAQKLAEAQAQEAEAETAAV